MVHLHGLICNYAVQVIATALSKLADLSIAVNSRLYAVEYIICP
jgi:hypothetical protein